MLLAIDFKSGTACKPGKTFTDILMSLNYKQLTIPMPTLKRFMEK